MNRKIVFISILVWLITLVILKGSLFSRPMEKSQTPETGKDVLERAENQIKLTLKVGFGRVREKPSLDSPIKFRLKNPDTVSIVEKEGDWYLVKLEDGRTGWVHQNLFLESLKNRVAAAKNAGTESLLNKRASQESKKDSLGPEGSEKEKEVATGEKFTLNVDIDHLREGPSEDAAHLFSLKKGETVWVVETEGNWHRLKLEDERTGWALIAKPELVFKRPVEGKEREPEIVIQKTGGELLTINFIDVDIRMALSALAMEREINITAAQGVKGKVTVHLYRGSLDEALRAITLAGGYSYLKDGALYYVYKPKEEKDPQARRLQVRIFKLKYAEIEKVQEVLDDIPGKRMIKIHEPSKTIIVEDTPENIGKIGSIIHYWDKMPRQVMIEVKILEITLDDSMAMGVDWKEIIGDVNVESQGFSRARMETGGAVINHNSGQFTARPGGTAVGGFANLIYEFGIEQQLLAALDALKTRTRVNTLSTPKIMTVHGKAARVHVGGQQGYRTTTTVEGITTDTINFIDEGTILDITPYIDDEGNILLDVDPRITSVDIEVVGGIQVPVVQTTEISTSLLLKNGETILIGGLIRDTKTHTKSMIPCAGNIPFFGVFFGSTSRTFGKRELVVLITPKIPGTDRGKINQQAAEEKMKEIEKQFRKEPLPLHKELIEFMFLPE